MSFDELRSLLEQLKSDATSVSDEQLAQAMDEIRGQVAEQRKATPNQDVIATLRELKGVREAVVAEQATRAEAAAQLASEASGLLDELDAEPEAPAPADAPAEQAPAAESAGEQAAPAESGDAPVETQAEAPDLQAVAASLAALTDVLKQGFTPQQPPADKPAAEDKPAGRAAGRIGQHSPTPAPAPSGDAVTLKVHAAGSDGSRQHGQVLGSTSDLGKLFADRLRSGNSNAGNGRQYVARVDTQYPESRTLTGNDADTQSNFDKIEAVTAPRALVAAPAFASMPAASRAAHATNERSAHAPRESRNHGAGCGYCSSPVKLAGNAARADAVKGNAAGRPWMISH